MLSRDRRALLKATLGLSLVFPKGFGRRRRRFKNCSPENLPLGGPQQLAYPMDPEPKVIRDGSLLNQLALVRLDPAQLSADTQRYAADGVVAYSAICTHQGCPVSTWKADAKALFCSCHAAQFDPAGRARVINGPAPRRLPVLPLRLVDGMLIAAGGFVGTVGGQTH
jgi:rieske iron-sulfur protein